MGQKNVQCYDITQNGLTPQNNVFKVVFLQKYVTTTPSHYLKTAPVQGLLVFSLTFKQTVGQEGDLWLLLCALQ